MSDPSKPAGFTNPFDWLRKKKDNQKEQRHEEQPQPQAAPAPPPAAAPPPPAAENPATPAATAVQERTYTVKPGDSLWAIAEHFYGDGSRYQQIAAANNIINPDHIEPGWQLKIP